MRITLKLDGVSTEQAREIARLCSQHRDDFRPDGGATDAPVWAPAMHCEGPGWTVYVRACPPAVAAVIAAACASSTA